MTKKNNYFFCRVEDYDIPEIFKNLLTIQCQKLMLAINKKQDIEAAKYYKVISDIHQFCRLYCNSKHRVPLPQANQKYWKIRGRITKYIYLLLLNIHELEKANWADTNENIKTLSWTPANELIEILEDRFIFYEYYSTVTETVKRNRSLIQELKGGFNPYSELIPHTRNFIDLCIKYAGMANKAYIKTELWNNFIVSKEELSPLIKNNYFPINEGVVSKKGVVYSNVNLIFDKSCSQFCSDTKDIAACANLLSKYTQGG